MPLNRRSSPCQSTTNRPRFRARRRLSDTTPNQMLKVDSRVVKKEEKVPTPEPPKVPTPEPPKEPTPEPPREPTPPPRTPTPEPVREPTPEPIKEPEPSPANECPKEVSDQIMNDVIKQYAGKVFCYLWPYPFEIFNNSKSITAISY